MKPFSFLLAGMCLSTFCFGQHYIGGADTAKLRKSEFKDSLSVRKLIDSTYEHKEEKPIDALKFISFAYNRAAELKNPYLLGGALNVKGAIFEDLGDFPTALKLHYQALRLFEKKNYYYGMGMVNNNIGRVYYESGKLQDALKYLSKAEEIAKEHKLDKVLVFAYANMANTYIGLNDLKTGLKIALKGDAINSDQNIKKVQSNNANTIAALYFFTGDNTNAARYYKKAIRIALEVNDMANYHRASFNLAELYDTTGQADPLPVYTKALNYYESIYDYANLKYAATYISNYYEKRGNFKMALQYYEQSVKANEKSTGLQAVKNMALLQTQYETEKKEQQINLLNKENTIQKLSLAGRNKTIGIILGLFALSGVIGGLLYNRNKLKQRAVLQEHLIRHRDVLSKAVIDAEEKERQRIAADLHDGVGQMFSAVKMNLNGLLERVTMTREEDRFLAEKTLALVDESCKEVRVISHQMMPNMLLRSGIASDVKSFIEKLDSENLKVHLEANGFKNKLESNVETVLYRVIQETVNNVIKHSKANQLLIKLNRDSDGITAIIADNGVGFDVKDKEKFTGIGLKNIAARIEYLKGTVGYKSGIGQGTEVNIWVPVA